MKKEKIMPIAMLVFAVLAAYGACLPTGVAVYDLSQSLEPFRCSYFNLVEGVNGSISLPMAAMGACTNLMSAGIYLAVKKPRMLNFMKPVALGSVVLSVVPILWKDPVIMLVPNMLLPIALIGEYVVIYYMEKGKKEKETPKLTGKRKK